MSTGSGNGWFTPFARGRVAPVLEHADAPAPAGFAAGPEEQIRDNAPGRPAPSFAHRTVERLARNGKLAVEHCPECRGCRHRPRPLPIDLAHSHHAGPGVAHRQDPWPRYRGDCA